MNYYHITCLIDFENDCGGNQHSIRLESIFPGKNEIDVKRNAINEYSKMLNCNLTFTDPLDGIIYEFTDVKYDCNMKEKGDYVVCYLHAYKYDEDDEELGSWPEVLEEMYK